MIHVGVQFGATVIFSVKHFVFHFVGWNKPTNLWGQLLRVCVSILCFGSTILLHCWAQSKFQMSSSTHVLIAIGNVDGGLSHDFTCFHHFRLRPRFVFEKKVREGSDSIYGSLSEINVAEVRPKGGDRRRPDMVGRNELRCKDLRCWNAGNRDIMWPHSHIGLSFSNLQIVVIEGQVFLSLHSLNIDLCMFMDVRCRRIIKKLAIWSNHNFLFLPFLHILTHILGQPQTSSLSLVFDHIYQE